jgi:uncharacterized heparinase superfamily protein
LRNYLGYVARRADVGAIVRAARGGIAARSAAGRAPEGLELRRTDHTAPNGFVSALPFDLQGQDRSGKVSQTIDLATRAWGLVDGPPWSGSFEDPEDGYAAHRFGWSLPLLLTAGGAGQVAQLVSAWLAAHPREDGAPGWDSYSVAERIANWMHLVAALTATGGEVGWLRKAIAEHAFWLRDHLELRGEATNNHLINDARALYLAGVLFGDIGLAARAREVLLFATPRMFVRGFLRESSTHYHRLLCRSYVDLLRAARAARDHGFAESVAGSLDTIAAALEFFEAGPVFPLIGDISPDSAPGCHESVSELARLTLSRQSRPAAASDAAAAGYYRLQRGLWSLTAHVNPLGYVPPWSHGHADIGAFAADWRGRPLLVDSGRATYQPSPIGSYGRSVRSHNGISIDGYEPCVAHGLNGFVPLLQPDYYTRPPRVNCDEGTGVLRIEHFGFTRVADGLTVVRAISVSAAEVVITDRVGGHGTRRLETFFHFHPSVRVTVDSPLTARIEPPEGALLLQGPEGSSLGHHRGRMTPHPAGWYAGQYGSLEACSTVVFTARPALPLDQRFVLRPL